MTFLVGSNGIVIQKDLGPDTAKLAQEMTMYDPGKSWQHTGPEAAPPEDAEPAQTQETAGSQ
jgi:hypothetical protein